MSTFLNVLLSMLGFSIFSAGIVLTKAGGAWLSWKGRKDRVFVRLLGLWLFGFLLYNVAVIPNLIASRALPSHVISAISGWGIPVVVLLSALWLKEKLYRSDIIYALVMFAAIVVLSLGDQTGQANEIDMPAFYALLALPLLLLLPVPLRRAAGKPRAILLATFAGCAGGLALVIMNIVVKSLGYDLFSYLSTPWPYLYILVCAAQFVAMQLAMRAGSMILVGPLQNALMIVYPALASWLVFHAAPGWLQLAMIAVIVFACVAILRRR